MHAKIFLKVVFKFSDWGIYGTTTSFHEMQNVRPLLDQMSVTLSFKNKFYTFV